MSDSTEWDEDFVSKSQLKREAEHLQALGIQLLDVPSNLFDQLDLPDDLDKALSDAKKIKSQNAYRRQLQFIGRVMRRVDEETVATIEQALQQWQLGNKDKAQFHKRLEIERDQLIAGNNDLFERYIMLENCDKTLFRQTLKQAQSEEKTGHKGKAYKKLFQLLRELN